MRRPEPTDSCPLAQAMAYEGIALQGVRLRRSARARVSGAVPC